MALGRPRRRLSPALFHQFQLSRGWRHGLVDLQIRDLGGEVVFGGLQVGLRGGEVLCGRGDLVFGCVEVVDEALAGGLVGVGEGGNVGALTIFVGVQIVEVGVDLVDGLLHVGLVAARGEDGLEGGFERRVVVSLGEDEGELVVVGVGEAVGCGAWVGLADVEADGLAGLGGDCLLYTSRCV